MKVSLELRYGREDEEMMGLQFCNEMGLLNLCLHPDKVPSARKLKTSKDPETVLTSQCGTVSFFLSIFQI